MKTMIVLLAGVMLLAGMASSANALTIQYSLNNGSSWTTIQDATVLGGPDLNPADGIISFTVAENGLSRTVTVTNTSSYDTGLASLATNLQERGNPSGTFQLMVSDMFSNPGAAAATVATATQLQHANADVVVKNFWGSALFSQAHLIDNEHVNTATLTGPVGLKQASINDPEWIAMLTTPFSLTQFITLTHVGSGNAQVDTTLDVLTTIPEPGTMMLLGAGFLGMAIFGKRRKNA